MSENTTILKLLSIHCFLNYDFQKWATLGLLKIKNPQGEPCGMASIGGPGGIRTPDLLVRSYAQ